MSQADDAGFLSRWSRRKAASLRGTAVEAPPAPDGPEPEAPPELPPIDSLTAASDFTVFLARGVSSAVQAQALRVAWTSDPAIAEFRGMAEYAWNFNAPGYGALAAGDDVAALLGQIVRSAPQRLLTQVAAVIDPDDTPPAAAAPEIAQATDAPVAPQPAVDAQRDVIAPGEPAPPAAPAPLRRHGRAMPT